MLSHFATHGSARPTWQPRRMPPATSSSPPHSAHQTRPRTSSAAHSRAPRFPRAPRLPPPLARRDDTDPPSPATPLTPLLRPRPRPHLAAPAPSETGVARAAAKGAILSLAPHPSGALHRLLMVWLRPWLKHALGWLRRRRWWWGRSPADNAARAELHAKLVRLTDRTRRPCTAEPGSVAYSRGFNQLLDELAALSALQAEAAAELVELVKREAHALAAESGGSLSVDRVELGGSSKRRALVHLQSDADVLVYVNGLAKEDHRTRERIQQQLRTRVARKKWRVATDDVLVVPCLAPGSSGRQHLEVMQGVYGNPEAAAFDPYRQLYDAAAYNELVKSKHNQVKAVMRLLRAWLPLGLPRCPRLHKTALDVCVLAAEVELRAEGQQPCSRHSYQHALAQRSLEVLLRAARDGEVVVVDAGAEWGYPRDVGHRCSHVWGRDALRIIHPTDPTCNTATYKDPNPDTALLAAEAEAALTLLRDAPLGRLLHRASSLGRALWACAE